MSVAFSSHSTRAWANSEASIPLRAGSQLDKDTFHEARRCAVLEGCKWDPQVRDTPTLAPFPLLIRRSEWNHLASMAQQLTLETLEAEIELMEQRPELMDRLGLPGAVRHALRSNDPLSRPAARVIRFDFHFTTEGWRISEANSDVPGGYTEASFFTELIAQHVSNASPAGHPANAVCEALASASNGKTIALLAAPGYMEDQQIVAFLARLLAVRGCATRLATPAQLIWNNGCATMLSKNAGTEIGAVFRFYQGEWLAKLPAHCGWQNFFQGSVTPIVNSGIAVISESKRFPLVWDELSNPMTAWRSLLPETCDPRDAPWQSDHSWLLKTAMCNNGDTVSARDNLDAIRWKRLARGVRWFPSHWVAQKRFETMAIDTPLGAMFPCIGIYTINGQACGAYARLSRSRIIDFAATDVALLIENE